MRKCKKINPKIRLTSAFYWQKINTKLDLPKTTLYRLSNEGSTILITLVVLEISKFSIYDVINDDVVKNLNT